MLTKKYLTFAKGIGFIRSHANSLSFPGIVDGKGGMMIFVWQGAGIFVLIVPIVLGVAFGKFGLASVVSGLPYNFDFYAALSLSGLLLFIFAECIYLENKAIACYYHPDDAFEIRVYHADTLFFIPMEIWAVGMFFFGIQGLVRIFFLA